jgi:hypothetical protein
VSLKGSGKRTVMGRRLLALTGGLITLGLGLLPPAALAGVDSIWEAIKGSEFRFARLQTDVPFYPIGWAQDTFYPRARFKDENGVLPDGEVVENTFDLGLLAPAYVAKRDMLILGADCAWDDLHVRSGPYQDQSVLRFAPVTAWLHQFGESEMVSAFAAPTFSKELRSDQPSGSSVFAGVIGMHWFSDTFQLLYGGVYQYSFGQQQGYPYLGVMWSPSPKCSVTLTFPWPAITYAPRDRLLLQLGVTPGGFVLGPTRQRF